MVHFMIWLSVHRMWFFGLLAFIMWALAQFWYFKRDIKNYRNSRRPHRWGVDMQTKSVTAGKKGLQ